MDSSYYTKRTAKYLRVFDRVSGRIASLLTQAYGLDVATAVLANTRQGFVDILPQLPYIGGRKNVFTIVIVVNGVIIAMYRAMVAEGKTAVDTIRILQQVTDDLFASIPGFIARFMGRMAFTELSIKLFQRQAKQSQQRQSPQDFVYEAKINTQNGDLALVFSECAVQKLYDAQNVPALKPFCNFADYTYSKYLGMGIDATQTLGLGCEQCVLAYKKGRPTITPPNLAKIVNHS